MHTAIAIHRPTRYEERWKTLTTRAFSLLQLQSATLDSFCSRALELDSGIRFAGIANNEGQLISHAYRKGLIPLLTQKESEISVLRSFIRAGLRTELEDKLGKAVFSYTLYEKVKRVTIPIKRPPKKLHVFMASFDLDVNPEPIVLEKIIPLLDELALQ